MSCMACGRQFHDECEVPQVDDKSCCCYSESTGIATLAPEEPVTRRRENVGVSAGRKRAAVDFPIDKDAPCEWRFKSNCGGGFHPILGCITGLQRHRHHGPDKTTTNNDRSNISLICHDCHNRWHSKNDPLYGEDKCPVGIKPKEHRDMTPQEILERALSG